jgi:hypothetical protein
LEGGFPENEFQETNIALKSFPKEFFMMFLNNHAEYFEELIFIFFRA